MSTEENKAIIARCIEVWNTGDVGVLREIIAPSGYVLWHKDDIIRPESGPEWYGQFVTAVRAHFIDYHVELEDLFAEGDRVAWRVRMGGTHQGSLMTPWGVKSPPTATVAWWGIIVSRIADGRIVEDWLADDELTFWLQLGVIRPPES